MEFWSTIANLARRKWVMVPAILMAVALGATAYATTPPRYVSSTTMVLTTNEFGGTESRDPQTPTNLTNPMLNFNDSLRTASAILIGAMGTPDVARSVGARGTTTLTVNDGSTNPQLVGLTGPFVYIVGESTSAVKAKAVVLEARSLVQVKLREWQAALNVPVKTYLNLTEVVPPSTPRADRARSTKLGLLGLIGGFVLTLAGAYVAERIRVARRFSRRAASQPPAGDAWTFANRPGRKGDHPSAPTGSPRPIWAVTEEGDQGEALPPSRAAGARGR